MQRCTEHQWRLWTPAFAKVSAWMNCAKAVQRLKYAKEEYITFTSKKMKNWEDFWKELTFNTSGYEQTFF